MSTISTISSTGSSWSPRKPDTAKLSADLFQQLDTDSTGAVDATEMSTALTKLGGTESDAAALVKGLDSNGDNTVSKQELTARLQALSDQFDANFNAARTSHAAGAQPAPTREDLFSALDSNGGGGIDKTELKNFLAQAPGGAANADAVFSKLDADGNEQVSKEELASGLKAAAQQGSTDGADGAHGAHGAHGGSAPPAGGTAGASASTASNQTYDAADSNQDGRVTVQERLAYQDKQDAKRAQVAQTYDPDAAAAKGTGVSAQA